ncbi:MAG: TldD/PmbA family protein [Cyanobacteria bacterium P01_D01_bin.73]
MDQNLSKCFDYLDIDADWVGLRLITEKSTSRSVRDGNPESNSHSRDRGLMIEVLANGQFGYAATNRLTSESIQAAAVRAHRQAIATSRWAVYKFSADVRPKAVGTYQSPQSARDDLSVADTVGLLRQACDSLKVSDKIIRTGASVRTIETEHHFVSSNGSDVHQQFRIAASNFSATAQDGTITQQRSDHGYSARSHQGSLDALSEADVLARAKRIGKQAVELLDAEECPDTCTTLVLAPDQMMLQLHESVGHPLELDRILGDERNYAGSSFVKLSDFGSLVYGSSLMNITFDPSVSGELASYGFDDVGIPATREFLIENGLLKRGLGSIESQQRSRVPGVANSRVCSWNRPPIDRMANINLEPGESSFDDIIGSIESGVYMEANRSWSIDDYRNKFQFGCEYGRLIENGKLTKIVRNPNYRGISSSFWRSLVKVGDASTFQVFGTPNCGKGEPNQVIRVGHASPVCAFENVEVFGGAG